MMGTFHCLYNDKPLVKIPTGRQQLLFAYLLLHSDIPVSRKQIAYLFWPDTSEQQAMTNLRKLLFDLKKLLPASDLHLQLQGDQVTWHCLELCEIDVRTIENLIDSPIRAHWELAAASFQGELLPGQDADWVIKRRETLSYQHAALLEKLISHFEENRNFDSALNYSIRLLQLDHLNESAHISVARLYALTGKGHAVRKQLTDLKAILLEELSVSPSKETNDAFASLLAMDTKSQIHHKLVHPLVGRQKEWAALTHSWNRTTQEKSILVVIEGEAGIGKTRLTEEFALWANSRTLSVLTAHCYSSGGLSPYESMISLLEQAKIEHLDQVCMTEISRLLPSLRERFPGLPAPGPLQESWQLRSWYRSIEKALFNEKPAILILDDLQWSDKETLQTIDYFMHSERSSPLLVVATLRIGEAAQRTEVQRFIEDQRSRRIFVSLPVLPFSESDTRLLVHSLTGSDLSPLDTRKIHDESGGNPLFINEIIKSAQADPHPENYGSSVLHLIVQRLADLPPKSQDLVEFLTILGKPVPHLFLIGLTPTNDHYEHSLELLFQLRFLKRTESGLLDFNHDRMREASRLRIGEAKRMLLHGKVAQAMEEGSDSRLFAHAEVAYHYHKAGMNQQAVGHYIEAAREAKQIYAHHQIIQYGSTSLPIADTAQTLDLLSFMTEAYRMLGQWVEVENTCRSWLKLANHTIPLELKAAQEIALGNCLRLQGKYQEALLQLEKSCRHFELLDNRAGLAEVNGHIGIVYQYLGESEQAVFHLTRSIEFSPEGHEDERFLGILATLQYERGHYSEALLAYKKQIRLAHQKNNTLALAKALGGMSLTYLVMDDYPSAFYAAEEKLQLSRSIGDRMGIAISIGIVSRVYLKCGYYQEALACNIYMLHEAIIIGDVRTAVIALGLLGRILDELGEEDRALWTLQQSERIARSLNVPFFLCDTLYYLGIFWTKRKQWAIAETQLRKALELAEKQKRAALCGTLETMLLRCLAPLDDNNSSEESPSLASEMERPFQTAPPLPQEASALTVTLDMLRESITKIQSE
jgi:DNA-binding SARP family transcriptional activator